MKAAWAGILSFGLVNIPVKVYSHSQEASLGFKLLHRKDMQPIRHARICAAEAKEVPLDQIVRGYEYAPGKYIPLEDEDFEKADVKRFRTIEIIQFSSKEELGFKYFTGLFYLTPEKGSEKGYVLLRDALRKKDKAGVGTMVIRRREYPIALFPEGEFLSLHRLYYVQEAAPPSELERPSLVEYTDEEINITEMLLDKMTKPFGIRSFKDVYSEELRKIIQNKIEGKPPEKMEEKPKKTPVENLVNLLKRSLDAFRLDKI